MSNGKTSFYWVAVGNVVVREGSLFNLEDVFRTSDRVVAIFVSPSVTELAVSESGGLINGEVFVGGATQEVHGN